MKLPLRTADTIRDEVEQVYDHITKRAYETLSAGDGRSGLASFNLTGQSNEPDNGLGDGDMPGDISITGVNPKNIALRAERSGLGTGRIYTLSATVTDAAGNSTTVTSTCMVPRDQRN